MHMTGVYPVWYPKELRYLSDKLLKGRIIATDFQKGIGEVIIPAIDEWIDASVDGHFVKERKRNPIGVPTKWVFKNGREFDILTHEQTTEQFEGWKGDLAWFDEPPPRDKYIATRRGLVDTKGRCWLTLTPLKQPWIYDDLYTKEDSNIFVVTMDIKDNPTLSPTAIEEFSKALTEEEKEARLHGKFMHLSGLVFKEFDPDIHICEPPKIEKYWIKYFSIDPHPRTPSACLWMAVTEQDDLYIYDELWLENMSVPQMAMAIKAQEAGQDPHMRLIDPAMDKTDVTVVGGFNVRKELMKYGIYCSRANNDFDLGISKIRQALQPKYSHLLGKNIPQLRISRNCKHTIYELQHYLWDEYTMRPEEHDPKQKAKKKNDHFIADLRYILNANPRFRRLEEEEEGVEWAGEFVKYPTKKVSHYPAHSGGKSYRDLIEGG